MFGKIKGKVFGNNHKREFAPNAMIIVERTKKRIFAHVPPRNIPLNSFEKRYNKQWFHILGLDLQAQFWPIEPPKLTEGRMPTDLYMAKHCAGEVEEVYGISMPLVKKIQIGLIIGFGIAILIVIFLLAAASGGS